MAVYAVCAPKMPLLCTGLPGWWGREVEPPSQCSCRVSNANDVQVVVPKFWPSSGLRRRFLMLVVLLLVVSYLRRAVEVSLRVDFRGQTITAFIVFGTMSCVCCVGIDECNSKSCAWEHMKSMFVPKPLLFFVTPMPQLLRTLACAMLSSLLDETLLIILHQLLVPGTTGIPMSPGSCDDAPWESFECDRNFKSDKTRKCNIFG